MDGMPGTGRLQTFVAHLFVVSRMLQDCCANANGTSDHQHKPCVVVPSCMILVKANDAWFPLF